MIRSETVIKNAKNLLLQTAKDLETIEIVKFQEQIFRSSDFKNMVLFNEKNNLKNSIESLIYTIKLVDVSKKEILLKIFNRFNLENKGKEDRVSLSQDNTDNNLSNYLYVGSSTTDFIGRLKYHLGVRKANGLYALHLSKWDERIDYEIHVCTYQVISKNKDTAVKNLTVEILEQQIWDHCKPLFGKRSRLG